MKEHRSIREGLRAQVGWGGLLVGWAWLAAGVPAWAQRATVPGKVVPLPNTVIEVHSPATVRIISPRERPWLVGDRVNKGEPLAILEHRLNLHDSAHLSTIRWDLLSVMLETRRVAVRARVEREKAERLLGLGSVSGQQVQALRAAELVAQADYEKRKALLEYQDTQMQASEIVRRGLFSPIDGDISFVNFTQGQLINEGLLLYRIVNLSQVGVSARLAETDHRRLSPNASSKIRFDSLPGKVYAGRLELTPPVVDPESRTRELLFRVQNPGEYLRFGMIGRVELLSP